MCTGNIILIYAYDYISFWQQQYVKNTFQIAPLSLLLSGKKIKEKFTNQQFEVISILIRYSTLIEIVMLHVFISLYILLRSKLLKQNHYN